MNNKKIGMTMKILYDHQIFSLQKYGGISRYFYELFGNADNLFEYEISCRYSENEYLRRDASIFKNHDFRGKKKLIYLINKMESIKQMKGQDYDVVHPTYYDPYFAKYNRKPVVITIHDMINELFPQYFKKDKILENKMKSIYFSDKIIAISESTKADILKYYPKIQEQKITVIYHGNSFDKFKPAAAEKDSDYILFTGERIGYKNFFKFIEAVHSLLKKYELRLMCTGKQFSINEIEIFKKYGIEGLVEHKFVDNEELFELYQNSLIFVFPSLYEGFGLPILESFAANCPVALSDTKCFREIAGEAGNYFDPNSVQDMRGVVERLIISEIAREESKMKGSKRIKQYSWQTCLNKTAKVYESVI